MEQKSMKQELDQLWLGLAKESNSPNVETPTATETQPVQTPVATPSPTTVPVIEPKAAEQPVTPVEPVTPVAATPKPSLDVDGVVEDWDTTTAVKTPEVVQTVPTVQPTIFDYSDLAKVLGQDIKTKEDLIKTVTDVKTRVDGLSKLPENLAKAIEIANQGGNYLEYLGVSVVDWSKEDPITLYENDVINSLTDQSGNVDYEKVDRILDKVDDDEKELRGRALQRQYVSYQAQQKANLENHARVQRQAFEQSVRQGIESLNEIVGFKLTPSHKEEIYSDIVRGEDLKQTDVNQRIINRFKAKYFDKIDTFRKTQIRNAVKREMLEEAQMPELKTTVEPTTSAAQKPYGLSDYLKELETGKRRF